MCWNLKWVIVYSNVSVAWSRKQDIILPLKVLEAGDLSLIFSKNRYLYHKVVAIFIHLENPTEVGYFSSVINDNLNIET